MFPVIHLDGVQYNRYSIIIGWDFVHPKCKLWNSQSTRWYCKDGFERGHAAGGGCGCESLSRELRSRPTQTSLGRSKSYRNCQRCLDSVPFHFVPEDRTQVGLEATAKEFRILQHIKQPSLVASPTFVSDFDTPFLLKNDF
jgi:hypothetical protein